MLLFPFSLGMGWVGFFCGLYYFGFVSMVWGSFNYLIFLTGTNKLQMQEEQQSVCEGLCLYLHYELFPKI